MQTTSTMNRDLVTSERNLSLWVVWAVVLVIGLVGWLLASNMTASSIASINRTETAAVRLQGNVEQLSAQIRLAALGDLQALSTIGALRSGIQDDLGLLQRGGYLFNDDKNPVAGVGESQRAQFGVLQSALGEFDAAAQPILGASEVLRQSAQAEQSLPQTLVNLSEGSLKIGRSANLSTGGWGTALAPLRKDVTRNELSGLPLVFAPGSNPTLANQWVSLLNDRAEDAQRLDGYVLKDPTLTTPEKELVGSWLKNITVLSNQLQVLNKSTQARAQAKESLPKIVQASAALEEAARSLNSGVHKQRTAAEQISWVKVAFVVAAWIGLAGLVFSIWGMASNYSVLRGGSVRGNHVVEAAERLNRNLRQAISAGGVHQDVTEPSDSPLFALSAMISQLLNSVTKSVEMVKEQQNNISLTTHNSESALTQIKQHQSQQQEALTSLHANTQSSVDELENLTHVWERLRNQFEDLMGSVAEGSGVATDNVWALNSIRENTQSTAKRIKRLSETTQNITTDVETVKDISRKVKVLALNLALEASSLSTAGRPFSALAQELERLAQNCDTALKEIDGRIDTIQSDAKETVASMESGTADVVRCGNLTSLTKNAFEKISGKIQPLRDSAETSAAQVHQMSATLRDEVNQTASIFQTMENQGEKIDRVRSSFGVFKNVSAVFQKWLNAPLH